MRSSNIVVIALVAIIIVAGAAAAIMTTNNNEKKINEKTDIEGYEIVPVSDNFENGIVAIGQDTFRWVTYFGLADKCVMVDINDKTNYLGKSFMYVGKDSALSANSNLKFGTSNCSIEPADVKTIMELNPSIIVVPGSWETEHINEMNSLRAAGLNIVHIDYIYTFLEKDTFKITPALDKQINVLATAFNMSERGYALKNIINDIVKDIREIASKVSDEERKTGYVGSLAYNGAHGANSSLSYFMPFELANIDNIIPYNADALVDSGVKEYSSDKINSYMKEDTVLFLDATGISSCTDNTSTGILKLFVDHEAYVSYPYIWTGINYENVLICAYQMLHDAYGLLSDSELEEKIDQVYEKILGNSDSTRSEVTKGVAVPTEGTSIYDDMSDVFEGARKNPTHGKISIDADGKIAYI